MVIGFRSVIIPVYRIKASPRWPSKAGSMGKWYIKTGLYFWTIFMWTYRRIQHDGAGAVYFCDGIHH
jgi:hypothetical protein